MLDSPKEIEDHLDCWLLQSVPRFEIKNVQFACNKIGSIGATCTLGYQTDNLIERLADDIVLKYHRLTYDSYRAFIFNECED